MPDRIQNLRVYSVGGLNSNDNFLQLANTQPGAAVRLVNYETSLEGGYRRIEGFRYLDSTYHGPSAGEGKILGVVGFHNTTDDLLYFVCARKDVGFDTYRFYYLDPFGTGWIATGPVGRSTVDPNGDNIKRVRFATFNFGTVNQLIAVDGANNAAVWDGTTWNELDPLGAGTSIDPGGNQIISYPAVVSVFYNTVFLSGDVTAPAVVSYSAPSDQLDWTAASGAGQLVFSQPVSQIKPWRNFLYIFGKSHIKYAYPDIASGFLMSDVTNSLGCIARDSVVEVGSNLIFMSQDGIRPVAGTANINDVELNLLSQSIQNTIDEIILDQNMDDLVAQNIRSKTQFRYFFDNQDITVPNSQGLIGSMRIRGQGPEWEFGELLGIRASCTWDGILNTTEYIIHGDYDGNIYRSELDDTTFNGEDILSIYTTPYLDFGDTEVRKLLRTVNTFVKSEGDVIINLSLGFDWDDSDAITPSVYAMSATGGSVFYDDGTTYDSGAVYGGDAKTKLKQNVQGSCFSAQLTFASQGDYPPHTIHGFVIEFSSKGRE